MAWPRLSRAVTPKGAQPKVAAFHSAFMTSRDERVTMRAGHVPGTLTQRSSTPSGWEYGFRRAADCGVCRVRRAPRRGWFCEQFSQRRRHYVSSSGLATQCCRASTVHASPDSHVGLLIPIGPLTVVANAGLIPPGVILRGQRKLAPNGGGLTPAFAFSKFILVPPSSHQNTTRVMPHKHTRKEKQRDASSFDLPPTAVAKPLPAYSKNASNAAGSKRKRPASAAQDDTPRAFQRLMDMQKKRIPSGLDDGTRPSKKSKKSKSAAAASQKQDAAAAAIPKIQAGEKLSEYSARVNAALPIAGLTRKGNANLPGLRERQTRMEKKLQRMQNEWRAEDRKRKDKEQEFRDALDEADAEDWSAPVKPAPLATTNGGARKGKKGKRRGGGGGADDDDDDDPWAQLKAKREKPAGLHDVAQAPPEFKKLPREIFKVKGGAKVNIDNVPNAAGSLRKREELGETRRSVIESYRKMMAEKRSGGGGD
ncbi:hypothetical protein FH972_022804 [Carpinus fangiana]|uniref:Uncharacterized protein n=1 Tax=Carpinus fangiana TaxID=176857 RepID=A0A5N6KTA8_9ROSI|nr:hypothetical protein FH972_022804 [Carpinus fangiana]